MQNIFFLFGHGLGHRLGPKVAWLSEAQQGGFGDYKKTNLLNRAGSQGGFGHKETHLKLDPFPFLIVE